MLLCLCRLRWIGACLVALAAAAGLLGGAAPVSAESTAGPAIDLTGELVAKRDGVITLTVTVVEELYATPSPPTVGDRFDVGIGRDALFLTVGDVYRMFVFHEGDGYSTRIRSVVHADGSPIDTSPLRRPEVRIALSIAACALIGLAGYGVYRSRNPRC